MPAQPSTHGGWYRRPAAARAAAAGLTYLPRMVMHLVQQSTTGGYPGGRHLLGVIVVVTAC